MYSAMWTVVLKWLLLFTKSAFDRPAGGEAWKVLGDEGWTAKILTLQNHLRGRGLATQTCFVTPL